jgi:HlyD family secretion protein
MRHVPRSPSPAAALGIALLCLSACSRAPTPDAYGNIEATEVVVSAQTSGQLLWFTPSEGNRLPEGAMVTVVDTTQLALQREQTVAQHAGTSTHVDEIAGQVRSLQAQREALRAQREALVVQKDIAQKTFDRTQRLFAQKAATAAQMDQAEQSNGVLVNQIKAQDQQIESTTHQIDAMQAQEKTAASEVGYNAARVAQIADQIRKSAVRNPIAGTVLTTYVRGGEVVQPGQPLYKIANLDTLELRAYVTEPQLAQVTLGNTADVSVDVDGGRRTLPGVVSWISSQAEFTPTPIATRDERTNLVYAIKLRVANPGGLLKIGMPADVQFTIVTAAR